VRYNEKDDNDDAVIEVGRSVIPVSPISHFPEKIGQVVTGLHFLTTAKVIRNVFDHDVLLSNLTCQGVLVDKSNDGLIYCTLRVNVGSPDEPTRIELTCTCTTGVLCGGHLCKCLGVLVQ